MAVAHILVPQTFDVTWNLKQHALNGLAVGLYLIHVWSECCLEYVSEELLIKAIQHLLYVADSFPDLYEHRVHHQLDFADPLDQLALNLV